MQESGEYRNTTFASDASATARTHRKELFEERIRLDAKTLWGKHPDWKLDEMAQYLSKRVAKNINIEKLNALYKPSTIERMIKGVKSKMK